MRVFVQKGTESGVPQNVTGDLEPSCYCGDLEVLKSGASLRVYGILFVRRNQDGLVIDYKMEDTEWLVLPSTNDIAGIRAALY